MGFGHRFCSWRGIYESVFAKGAVKLAQFPWLTASGGLSLMKWHIAAKLL
jgi:hypothetical protein